jgi:hypothetical protein
MEWGVRIEEERVAKQLRSSGYCRSLNINAYYPATITGAEVDIGCV